MKKPRLSKSVLKDRQLLMTEFRKVIPKKIEGLKSPEEASETETRLYQCRAFGLIEDWEYKQWKQQIHDVCKKNNWPLA